MVRVRFALALFSLAGWMLAQTPIPLAYDCPADDINGFGLSCAPEEPCAVFLELASIDAKGAKVFLTGNLHTEHTTLYGVLLSSDDGGKTWTEPLKRVRAATLEQIQFVDPSDGFISGEVIEPLPRDPFLLITNDGGKSWSEKPVFEDSQFGSIAQFWFESKTNGSLILDHSGKHELYQTTTSGESWERKESTGKPPALKPREENAWRLRPDGKVYHVEHREGGSWQPVTSFTIHIADCK
jgi:hypothetical protein